MRLLLIQGGAPSEHEVSLDSGRMIADALDKQKYDIVVTTISKGGAWSFEGEEGEHTISEALVYIEKEKFDVAFIALHGAFGEDGRMQAVLEAIGLPYTGSGIEASVLAMDKAVSASLFQEAGLRVPSFLHVRVRGELNSSKIPFPCIVKPCHGGSSVGVVAVQNEDELKDAVEKILTEGDSAIVQEQIVGRELTCGILDNEQGIPEALPPTEIIPKGGGMFDYEAKYVPGASQEITPAQMRAEQIVELQAYTLKAHMLLGCSGMSRSDFMLKDGIFYLLETNTIPGMTGTSLLPQEAKAAGIEFGQMLDRVITGALRKK